MWDPWFGSWTALLLLVVTSEKNTCHCRFRVNRETTEKLPTKSIREINMWDPWFRSWAALLLPMVTCEKNACHCCCRMSWGYY